jgi:small-conductance mechanosensitive channel
VVSYLVFLAFFGEQLTAPLFEFQGNTVSALGLIAFVVVFGIGLAAAALIQSELASRLLIRIGFEQNLFVFFRFILSLFFVIGCFVLGLNLAGLEIPWEQRIPGINLSVGQILRLVFLVVLVFWLSSLIKRRLILGLLNRSGFDRALQYAVAQVSGYVVLTIGILLALQTTGIDLSALTIFAGALGVGIGLGLQSIASNFISGLVILAERPIKIGDRVEVDNVAGQAVAGQVIDIRARSTTILTNDNISLIVPNSAFINNTVTNWSHGDQKVRFRIPVGVAYGSDLDQVRKLLIAVAKQHPASLTEPEPTVFFDSFGNSSLNLELVVWSAAMSARPRKFRSDLNFAIERALREGGIQIPYPQRDVHLRTLPPNWPDSREP